MADKVVHAFMFFALLVCAFLLILFCHEWLPPDMVFTGMLSGLAGVIGTRITANGYKGDKQTPPQTNKEDT